MALNPELQAIYDKFHMVPIWDEYERVLDWEHLWNAITAQLTDAQDDLIEYINDFQNRQLRHQYPIGIKIEFANTEDPNVIWAGSGMVWQRAPEGYVSYSAHNTDSGNPYYVGSTVHAEGNSRAVPLLWHNHKEHKHGHLNATYNEVLTRGNLYTNLSTEYNVPAYIGGPNGQLYMTNSSEGIPQGFDFNPRTPTSSQIYIGATDPIQSPPIEPYSKATANPAPGNIDVDAKGGMPLQGDATGSASKFPYKLPTSTGARGLETKYAGTENAKIDVSPMGRCYVQWIRTA